MKMVIILMDILATTSKNSRCILKIGYYVECQNFTLKFLDDKIAVCSNKCWISKKRRNTHVKSVYIWYKLQWLFFTRYILMIQEVSSSFSSFDISFWTTLSSGSFWFFKNSISSRRESILFIVSKLVNFNFSAKRSSLNSSMLILFWRP